MILRTLQIGANAQRQTMGVQPQMAPPTYAQVAQMPPRRSTVRSVEDVHRRQEITRDKRAADAPRAADLPHVAPRAQGPSTPLSDLQPGPEIPGTSNLSDDLRRYVNLLVRQYVDKRPGNLRKIGPATDNPVLDTDMLEEDRLVWQQLATGAQLRESPDEDHPMLGEIDTTGDDWESLDAEDFPMEEAEQKQNLSTGRQINQPRQRQTESVNRQTDSVQQPQIESVTRQTDPPAAPRQLMPQQPQIESVNRQTDPPAAPGQLMPQQPQIESVNRQTDPSAVQRQLIQHPQFPADAQMQRSVGGRNWQVVPTRWWEQPRPQRQQMQPRMGRFEEQAPQPWQQLPHPQRRMQRPEQWNFGEGGEQFTPQPPSYRQRGGSSRGGQQGMRGRATGGRDVRIGTEAGWATNPETLGKDSYNPALPPRAWGYIYKSGRCYWCFQKWRPGHVCDRDAPREIPSLQVRSEKAAVSDLVEKLPESQSDRKQVEDEVESTLPCLVNKSQKLQKFRRQ